MEKRFYYNRKNKVLNNPVGAENVNVPSTCNGIEEFPSCKAPSSCDKVPFVKNFVDAKLNSKVSTSPSKAVTNDFSGNLYTPQYFPLNKSAREKESEKMRKPLFEMERQAQLDCTNAVKPKYKIKTTMTESNLPHQKNIPSDKFSREDNFESYDEYAATAEDGFKQKFSDQYERRKNEQSSYLGKLKMKESLISKVNLYKNCKSSFLFVFRRWLSKRRSTLEELRSLYKEVHDDALKYNQGQAALKEFSYNSRALKERTDNQALDFLTSLTTFVSDAVSGIASFAEACNVDSYNVKFREILESDAKITKDLYVARSQYIARYHGVEEMIREFHSDTLISTVCKISTTLEVDKHWKVMTDAFDNDDVPTMLNEINYFFDNASRREVFEKVSDSIQRYVSDNPAALDACKSTGKALYGAFNTFGEKNKRGSLMENVNSLTNSYFMLEDEQEVERLKSIINEDTYQNKLELRIESAIESLESEMKEMSGLYFQLSKSHKDDNFN